MTLYLLFEKLDSGAMTLQTPISISQHAAGKSRPNSALLPVTRSASTTRSRPS